MKINKNDLISTYAQSVGIEAARELITKKIHAAALTDKERYTEEEITRICNELLKEGGLIGIIAQTFLVHLEHKRSEEQTLLLDNIETQIWYLADIETYGAVNKARAYFLGLSKANLEGRNIRDISITKEADVCIAGNSEVFDKKKQTRTEQWVRNGKGEERLLAIIRTPKLDEKGEVEYVICAAEDITERKRAEEKLRESEERYRLLAESAQDFIFLIDSDMRIQYTNSFAAEQLGYSTEELIGKRLDKVFPPDLSNNFEHDLQTVFESGEHLHAENRITLIDKELWIDTQLIPLKKESGEIKSILGISRDITDRKRAEDKIKASLKEKEALLQETHHRVKNNLQVVSSLLSMQARAAKDEDTVDILTESRNRIDAMALIHTQLYESGNLSAIKMKGFVDKMVRQMFQSYPVRDMKLTPTVNVADYPIPVFIAVPVGLIFNELISNTFKHAFVNRKEGEIEVSLCASGKSICMTVRDDGVGLPEGFDINTTTTLGLHLVKILAEDQLRGKLEVVSDDGASFKIVFEIETLEGN